LEAFEITVDPSAISRIESGSRIIRLNEAVALAQIFERPVDELIAPPTALDQLLREAEADVGHANKQVEEAHQKLTTAVARAEHLRHRLVERYRRGLQDGAETSSSVPKQPRKK
jgi:transcriptional regulator with XRE-family HTH domain